jgi:hypothetical protein
MSLVQPALLPLGGLHFLIHPFFDAAPGPYEKILPEKEFIAQGRPKEFIFVDQEQIEEDLRQYPSLTEAYVERAAQVGPKEALAAFLAFERGVNIFFDKRYEPLFARFLTELQSALGARLLIFHRQDDPVSQPEIASVVRMALARRGWSVSPETPSYAFGESMDHCIPRAVRNLRKGFGLRKFTHVNPLFTDLRFQWPHMSEAERRDLRHDMRHYGLLLKE